MPRDGSGVHSLDPGYLAVTGETVLPSNHNPPLEDLSASITESIARTGVTSITANIPFNDKRITGLGDATADADALNRRTADSRYAPVGFGIGLGASVAANALTISIVAANGDTPSSSAPVLIDFRSPSAALGTQFTRSISAATTLVISSGSTMGFANSTAGRIWIVAFDDAGTVRLGAINCRNGFDIFRLGQFGVASSTAEGGAGSADSAHVFYTGTAVTSKAYTILGYFEWTTGLTTAGTWSIGPDRVEFFKPGAKLPGEIVQTLTATNPTYGTNNANVIPIDDTIPQNTEGSQISVTAAITPVSPANILKVSTCGTIGSTFSGSSFVGLTICRSDQSNAIIAALCAVYAASIGQHFCCEGFQLVGTTSAFTVSNRYGPTTTSYSATVNGTTARLYGSAQAFWLSAMEIVA